MVDARQFTNSHRRRHAARGVTEPGPQASLTPWACPLLTFSGSSRGHRCQDHASILQSLVALSWATHLRFLSTCSCIASGKQLGKAAPPVPRISSRCDSCAVGAGLARPAREPLRKQRHALVLSEWGVKSAKTFGDSWESGFLCLRTGSILMLLPAICFACDCRIHQSCCTHGHWLCGHGVHRLLCEAHLYPHQQHHCGVMIAAAMHSIGQRSRTLFWCSYSA